MPYSITEDDMKFTLTKTVLTITWNGCAVATMDRAAWMRVVKLFAAVDEIEQGERSTFQGVPYERVASDE